MQEIRFLGVPVSPPNQPTRIVVPLLLAEAYLVMGRRRPFFLGAENLIGPREPINSRRRGATCNMHVSA